MVDRVGVSERKVGISSAGFGLKRFDRRRPEREPRRPIKSPIARQIAPKASSRLIRVKAVQDFSAIDDVDRRYSPGVSTPLPGLQGVSQAHADIV